MKQPAVRHTKDMHQVISPIYIGLLPSSPVGSLWVAVSQHGLAVMEWSMSQADFTRLIEMRFYGPVVYDESHTSEPLRQITEYLTGSRHQFDLPLDLSTSSIFQRNVLSLTSQIPYGHTSTYKDIAVRLGNRNAARAVGRVEATNPIPLVIPCHRVLGSDGSLHGYGGPGGIKLKAWLLELEQKAA
jgi:methylated-DNA-[protein]-cysteine S-methyltransferase